MKVQDNPYLPSDMPGLVRQLTTLHRQYAARINRGPVSYVSDLPVVAGTAALDLAAGDYFTLPLTANATLTIANLPVDPEGRTVLIRVKQDAMGGRTLTLPASFKPMDGSDTAVQSAANAVTVLVAMTFDKGVRWEYAMRAGG